MQEMGKPRGVIVAEIGASIKSKEDWTIKVSVVDTLIIVACKYEYS